MTDARRDACIADAAAVTALGESLDATWTRLRAGESAVAPIRRFGVESLDCRTAACVADLDADPREGENLVCALMRRALDALDPLPAGTFVIWTGVKGDAEFVEAQSGEAPEDRTEYRAPWLPRHYRRWVCRRLGLDPEEGIEINAACASSAAGIALAADMVSSGERESVLVCAADIVSRFTHVGFCALKALSPTVCRPFDARRDGLCLGDGASAVLVATRDVAERRLGAPPVRIAGWGLANDANHITGPARDGRGLKAAIGSALDQAGCAPDEIEAYCAHGTGTVYNDAMELTAVEALFGDRRFPIFSVKGAIGHTLGAAGAIEAAISARALRDGVVPPTGGLDEPEERGRGRVSNASQDFAGHRILTTNSGFGGVNAALILERRL
ncbi:beta-ketoacyl-[acyl-carrier-protein] synthase family protein [Candidatus Sumerlaeota bacterium]|nr:beta-ketoacyl-[acyl-carrier-protein] synthase family protein [Candidatus Sumerlaeota bacterium]